MDTQTFVNELKASLEFFTRSTSCLTEKHAHFAPSPDVMTTCQQIAHVGQTIDWFMEGIVGEGFDMNFEEHLNDVRKVTTMAEARDWVNVSYAKAMGIASTSSIEDLAVPMPEDSPVFANTPKFVAFPSIVEHTAHHRGALTIYSRLLGLTPAMPYMEAPGEEPQAAVETDAKSKAKSM